MRQAFLAIVNFTWKILLLYLTKTKLSPEDENDDDKLILYLIAKYNT